jgi:hypothetical protein
MFREIKRKMNFKKVNFPKKAGLHDSPFLLRTLRFGFHFGT